MRDDIMAVKRELEELKKESFAMELLKDSKKSNKRMAFAFSAVLIVVSTFWFATMCYLIYTLNQTGIEETITNTKTQKVEDVENISNSNIINGDMNGEDKAN